MFERHKMWWLVAGGLLLFLLALNFLSFWAARSKTETNHSLSTYRAGEMLPDSITPGFTLSYAVNGEGQLGRGAGISFASRIRGANVCRHSGERTWLTAEQSCLLPVGRPLIRPAVDAVLRARHAECADLLCL